MFSGVYKIVNLINGKVYIGSTKNCKIRWSQHLDSLCRGDHNKHIQAAFNKYGEENFSFEIIETVDDLKSRVEREQYWIDFYKSYDRRYGYNILSKAESVLGMIHSVESRSKMSEAKKGTHRSEETKAKIREALKGREFSEETKRKIGLGNKGKQRSEEFKQKVSLFMKENQKGEDNSFWGKKHTEETKAKMSLAGKGKIISEETKAKMSLAAKGENNHFYGKKHSEETKEKMRLAHKKEEK